jgi:hypothetical protein
MAKINPLPSALHSRLISCSGQPLTSAGSLSQPGPSIPSNHSPQALGCSLGFRSDSRKSGEGGLYSGHERKLLSRLPRR